MTLIMVLWSKGMLVILLRRIIEQAGEVGAERGLASPAFNQRFHVLPWHRNKND